MDDVKLKYCRFCAEQKNDVDLLDLEVYSYIYKELEEKLAFFSFKCVDLSSSCTLPRTICFLCNTSLNNAYEFFTKVKRSQTVLNDVFYKQYDVKLEIPTELSLYNDSKVNIKAETNYEAGQNDDSDSEISNHDYAIEKPASEDGQEFVVTYSGIPIFEHDVKATSSWPHNVEVDQSWSGYPWHCKVCPETFADIALLREHSKGSHGLCCAFKCADCSETFDDFEAFVHHARGHRIALRHYCQYCNVKIEDTPTDTHTHNTHTKKQKICPRCGKIFESNALLKEHVSNYKPLKRKVKEVKKKSKKTAVQCYVLSSWETDKLQDKSWTGYPWACQICSSAFPDVLVLRLHTKEVHGKCFSMKCADCPETLDSYRGFVHHVGKHRPFMKQYCHYCNFKFAQCDIDQAHVQRHFSRDEKLCECCGEIFPDRTALQTHVATYDPPKPKRLPYMKRERPLSIDDFTCDVCNKVTKSVNALRAHKMLHTERNRDYTCDRCGKAFYTKGALSSHNVIHETTEPEVCKICKKTFKTLLKLKHHVLTHKGEKPFRCEICNRCFRLKNQMVHHAIIHTNQMPYQCQYCDKAFRHKNNLKTHENQHTGARPYACSDCGMDFTNWANCNKHMKRKHGTTLAKTTLTPQGKLPINPKSGKPKKVKEFDSVREWTELILAPQKRGKKTKVQNSVSVSAGSDSEALPIDALDDNVLPVDRVMGGDVQ